MTSFGTTPSFKNGLFYQTHTLLSVLVGSGLTYRLRWWFGEVVGVSLGKEPRGARQAPG